MKNATRSLEVFFDAACPLCSREVDWIRTKDRDHAIQFTDISSPEFDPSLTGRGYADLMSRIHARLADGRMIAGVEVFRQIYLRLGFVRLVELSRAPGLSQLLDAAYEAFADRRLALSGRCEVSASPAQLSQRSNHPQGVGEVA